MKIFVSVPCYGNQIYSQVSQDILDANKELMKNGHQIWTYMPSSPFISLNRNNAVKAALENGADWILMWDADIHVPNPKFIVRLIETAYKNDAALVGLAVRIKVDPNSVEFACGKKADGGYERLTEMPKEPIEVDVMGAGVSLVNCAWLRDNDMEQPYYQFRDGKNDNGPTIMPEDWVFCEKIKAKGGKIMVDPTIETIHYGVWGWHYEIK